MRFSKISCVSSRGTAHSTFAKDASALSAPRSERPKTDEARGSDGRSQLDRRQARAEEAAQGTRIQERRSARWAGPRRKELNTGQRVRAERANTTDGVRAREASSMDGLGRPTRASSDEPGRRQQHNGQRIQAYIAVRGMARPGGRSQREGLGWKEPRERRAGRNEANAPSPATGACAEGGQRDEPGSGDRIGDCLIFWAVLQAKTANSALCRVHFPRSEIFDTE